MIGTTMVQAKAFWQSKMVWLGVVELILGLSELVSTTPILEGSTIAGAAASVAGALTIVLRLFTNKPVSVKAETVYITN